jgi:mRNA interferase HigB
LHIISRKRLKETALRHPDAETALDVWFRIAKAALWQNLAEVRRTFASADAVGKWTIFNIRGNKYRLVAEINYKSHRIYIRHVLTHAEYDREGWKK